MEEAQIASPLTDANDYLFLAVPDTLPFLRSAYVPFVHFHGAMHLLKDDPRPSQDGFCGTDFFFAFHTVRGQDALAPAGGRRRYKLQATRNP